MIHNYNVQIKKPPENSSTIIRSERINLMKWQGQNFHKKAQSRQQQHKRMETATMYSGILYIGL